MHGRGSGALRFLFADHLSRTISSLQGLDVERDVVLLVEVADEATYVPHHKKKIAFLFAAMRHFADELRAAGIRVDYVRLPRSRTPRAATTSIACPTSASTAITT